jgi:Sulfotransferase family
MLLDASRETVARQRVPDFFIVGHFKSGTSSLYEMLRSHPQIFMPDAKEPRYLAGDMRASYRYKRGPDYPQTWEQYLALFTPAAPDQLVGEASAGYLWSQTAAATIAAVAPDARIIAILREPAAFLRSFHSQLLQSHIESQRDLRKALALESARRRGRRVPFRSHLPQLLHYSEQVRYVDQLRRYHAHFSRERVLLLIYDDFRADNEGTVRRVLRFLDLDGEQTIQTIEKKVTRRQVRSQLLDDATYWLPRGQGSPLSRALKTAIKAVSSRRQRRSAVKALRRHAVLGQLPPVDEELELELRRRFKPEVIALSEYLDRDLVSLWGYADV